MKAPQINVSDVMKTMTIVVRVKGIRACIIRYWIGMAVCQTGRWIMGAGNVSLEHNEDDL